VHRWLSRRPSLSPLASHASHAALPPLAALARARPGVVALVAAVALLVLAGAAPTARADGAPFDGPWDMTAVTETFTVQQWSAACGPPPVSGVARPAGTVMVLGEGGELVLGGGARALRTDRCLDPMPTLAPEAHSTDGKSWRTRCVTPQSDPRRAVVNTAYFATGPDAIAVAETGRYEFRIGGAHCVADVKRDASLRRVVAPAPAASAPAAAAPAETEVAPAAPPPAPKPDCAAPGDPARLEVRPSRKLLRIGDSFAFHALVLDAKGCPTATSIRWSIGALRFKDGREHVSQPLVDARGKVTVPAADFSAATFDVVATAAGHGARASVEVASPGDYEALLAQSGLDANGERDEPSVAILATGSIGASDARAEGDARRRRLVFMLVVGGLALALGILAVVGALRGREARRLERAAEERHAEKMREFERQKREREERHDAQMRAHLESVALAQQAAAAAAARGVESGPMFCPSCRREFASGSAFCPFDANRLVAVSGHEDLMGGPMGGICPTCRRGFNPGVRVCPHDGEELMPAAAVAAAPAAARGKICPTCGGRFDGTAAFCGKDGTQLVLLN